MTAIEMYENDHYRLRGLYRDWETDRKSVV